MKRNQEDPALESRILGLLAKGDHPGAAEAAIRGYGPGILGSLIPAARSRDLAEEAFQQACENMWTGLSQFQGRSSFRAWFYKIGYYAMIGLLRDPARKRAQPLDSHTAHLARAVSTSVKSHARRSTIVEEIRATLDPGDQMLLTLRVDRDLSWEEIAEVLSTESGALRTRFHRLVRKLKTQAQNRS